MVPSDQQVIDVGVERLGHPLHVDAIAGRNQVVVAAAFKFVAVYVELVSVAKFAEIGRGLYALAQSRVVDLMGDKDDHVSNSVHVLWHLSQVQSHMPN